MEKGLKLVSASRERNGSATEISALTSRGFFKTEGSD